MSIDPAAATAEAAVILFLVAAAVAVAVDARDGRCGGDNCARQVTGARYGLTPLSSRRADCFNFMKTIIVPDAMYVSNITTPGSFGVSWRMVFFETEDTRLE